MTIGAGGKHLTLSLRCTPRKSKGLNGGNRQSFGETPAAATSRVS